MSDRQTKTPRQRAEEALTVAQRRVARCEKRVTATHTTWEEAQAELAQARERLLYVAKDPALPPDGEGATPDAHAAQAAIQQAGRP